MSDPQSDALVFFGATGDLAYKKIFPALQAMVRRGHLDVPVIGVAKAGWNLDQLKARARDSLEKHGGVDEAAFAKLCGAAALRRRRLQRPGDVRRPCARRSAPPSTRPHYLAIPPALFGTVVEQLGEVGLRAQARGSSSRSRSAATSPRRRRSTGSS